MVWRISDRATFELLRTRARRARIGPVSVAFCPVDEPRVPRVAYSVGRRTGGAVQRNRLRRRLRATVAEIAPGLAPGAYLVSARAEAAAMSFDELREAVAEAMGRVTNSDSK